MSKFRELLSQCVGKAYSKQLVFNELLGERDWKLDLDQGIVTFGQDMQYPVQLLGTEDEAAGTWLWSWANRESNLPANLLITCNEMRQWGEQNQVAELTRASIPLTQVKGYELAVIAAGVNKSSCFYRGPYPGGAIFFLVNQVPQDVLKPATSEQVAFTITESVTKFRVGHSLTIQAYLSSEGYTFDFQADMMSATKGEHVLTFKFDSLGRLLELGSKDS